MAKGLTVDQTIYKRMRHLSAEQKPDPSTTSPLIQDPSPGERTPIYSDSDGPDHRTTEEPRL